jgi:hypothetical protein
MSVEAIYARQLQAASLDELRRRLTAARISMARPAEQTQERQEGWAMVLEDIEAEISSREQQRAA